MNKIRIEGKRMVTFEVTVDKETGVITCVVDAKELDDNEKIAISKGMYYGFINSLRLE